MIQPDDREDAPRPSEPTSDGRSTSTGHSPAKPTPAAAGTREPGVLSNFVERTDNDYNGVQDDSLIGQDLPDDEEDEDGERLDATGNTLDKP